MGKPHEFGCVLINLNIENWNEILNLIDNKDVFISTDPLISSGKTKKTHITAFYGLHDGIPDNKIISIIKNYRNKDLGIKIGEIGIFENKDFDVLKYSVSGNENLYKFNKELSKLPSTKTFPDYKPHITIAYLKVGHAKKYLNLGIKPKVDSIKNIEYSKPNGELIFF